jgi:hypothetical protein
VVGTDVPAPRRIEAGSRPIPPRPEDVPTVITTSYLIGDLAADRIRTLLAEADRWGGPPEVPHRTAPIRRWSWRRVWRRAPGPLPALAPDSGALDPAG